ILAGNHRGPHDDANVSDVSEGNLRSVGCCDQNVCKRVHVFTKVPGIAYANWKTLPTLNGSSDVLSAAVELDNVLCISNIDSVARGGRSIDAYLEIWSARYALRIQIYCSRYIAQNSFDLDRFLFDRLQVRAEHFDTHLSADSGRQHIDAVPNR